MHSDEPKMASNSDHIEGTGSDDVDDSLKHVQSRIDFVDITQKNPYLEPNFIGTYVATAFGWLAASGGFTLPATSLAYIDADLGESN